MSPTPEALTRPSATRRTKKTGWPVWPVLTRTPLTPYPYKDVVECWMAERPCPGGYTPRFLRGHPTKVHVFSLLRDYEDDLYPIKGTAWKGDRRHIPYLADRRVLAARDLDVTAAGARLTRG